MAITPREALLQAQSAMKLTWVGDQQVDPVTTVVATLAAELTSAEAVLRTVQALWLPEGARNRPSAERVVKQLESKAPTLAQSDHAVAWARTVAWAALRVGVEQDRRVAAMVSLMRSGAEWTPTEKLSAELLKELVTAASRTAERRRTTGASAYDPFNAWTDEDDAETKIETLKTAIEHIESSIIQPSDIAYEHFTQTGLLWWGQSLYSTNSRRSYRDIEESARLFWMAEDMSAIGTPWPSEARTAFFVETVRRLNPDIDSSLVLRDRAELLFDSISREAPFSLYPRTDEDPRWLVAILRDEPTGLPITLLVRSAFAGLDKTRTLSELKKGGLNLDMKITGRQWASWVSRERALLRFLGEAWPSTAG